MELPRLVLCLIRRKRGGKKVGERRDFEWKMLDSPYLVGRKEEKIKRKFVVGSTSFNLFKNKRKIKIHSITTKN